MNTLIAKLAKASQKVGALAPDKVNAAQNYPYISADKMLQRAGDALAEEGIVIVPSIVNEATQETNYTDNYGKAKTRYDAVVLFEMYVSDGEGELKAQWVGRGSDFSVPDKALYKAITSGHKYYLAKLLNIGVGNEDSEHENVESTQDAQARPQQAKVPEKGGVLLTAEQSKRIRELGTQYYGEEWGEKGPELAELFSKGAVKRTGELNQVEAGKLIKGLEKKIDEANKQKVAA